jgi:hypothetical protein
MPRLLHEDFKLGHYLPSNPLALNRLYKVE